MRDVMLLFVAFVVFVRLVRGRRRPSPATSLVDELALRRAVNRSMENRKYYAAEDE